jgi:transcriptional regulator with XRE-family HTH domain
METRRPTTEIGVEASGRFSTALKAAIESANLSLVELAQKADSSYEHMRKLVAGKAYPSIHLLRVLASTLKADRDEWAELVEADKLHAKYKHLPKFLGQSADMEKFEPIIPQLSQAGQEMLLQMAKTLLRQEKAQQK